LTAPTEITAQNGALIKQSTNIAVTGCGGVKAFKATKAQLLAKALQSCRKRFKHGKKKRTGCEKQARKRYAAKKAAKKSRKR